MIKTHSLKQRRIQPEVMDQPGLEQGRHWQALGGLARINWWSGSAGILWPAIRHLVKESAHQEGHDRSVSILDVACGAGDVSIALHDRLARAGWSAQLDGVDISSNALAYARKKAKAAGAPIRFLQMDALAADFPGRYDVVFCSLFLHHLQDDQAVNLMRRMVQASRRLVLISDLVRSRLAWTGAYLATHLLTTSDVVHTDGPLSVQAAFRPEEALALAHRAGMQKATVVRRWPFRFLLTWRRA